MLGVMERMQMASWSIGMLGQGVQMFGMNATLIQNSITGLIQLLAQSTHSFNDLVGCKSDQTTAPLAQYKLAPPTTQLDPMTGQLIQHHSGELVPKSDEELEEGNKRASKRRRTARWLLGFAIAAFLYWRYRRSKQREHELINGMVAGVGTGLLVPQQGTPGSANAVTAHGLASNFHTADQSQYLGAQQQQQQQPQQQLQQQQPQQQLQQQQPQQQLQVETPETWQQQQPHIQQYRQQQQQQQQQHQTLQAEIPQTQQKQQPQNLRVSPSAQVQRPLQHIYPESQQPISRARTVPSIQSDRGDEMK